MSTHDQTTTAAQHAPRQRRSPRVLVLLLQVQSIWLITASAGRVLIMLSAGSALDPLPFISFALGVISIFIVTSWSHHR